MMEVTEARIAHTFLDQLDSSQAALPSALVQEALENILIGVGLFFITIFSKALMYVCFDLMYSVRLFTIHTHWLVFAVLFLLSDLSFYWFLAARQQHIH